jgi:hypothetical protein
MFDMSQIRMTAADDDDMYADELEELRLDKLYRSREIFENLERKKEFRIFLIFCMLLERYFDSEFYLFRS